MQLDCLTRDEAKGLFNEIFEIYFNSRFDELFERRINNLNESSKRLIKHNMEILKIDDYVKLYCDTFGVAITNLRGKSRKREITEHRHILFYILWSDGKKYSKSYIAIYFGKRDHTSVISGINKIAGFMQIDKNFKERVQKAMEIF